MRLHFSIAFAAVGGALLAQLPFDLDAGFRTDIDRVYVSSVLPLTNGQLLVSGQMRFPDESGYEGLARLNTDGSRDTSFPVNQFGGGRLTSWNGKIYVSGGQVVERLLLNGMSDPSWTHMNTFPLFTSGQGGDYHVFPDGRLLFTGSHGVQDPVHGFNGQYSLVWFSNTGWLDTTRIHRQTNGAIYRIAQLNNGQFYCGGAFTEYEGNPAVGLVRIQPDGSYDPSFQTSITWGDPVVIKPLADGRLMAAGLMKFQGSSDTLRLVRFMPDGSLDPTFNNHLDPERDYTNNPTYLIASILEMDPDRFIITGGFNLIDGDPHGHIAMIDSTGHLVDVAFQGTGAGTFLYQNYNQTSISGIMPTNDGTDDYWIWGSYHGYDDGTTDDTLQRMVSRLHGLSVGVEEPKLSADGSLRFLPNPSTGQFTLHNPRLAKNITVYTSTGQQVWQGTGNTIDLTEQPPGVYTAVVATEHGRQAVRLVVVR